MDAVVERATVDDLAGMAECFRLGFGATEAERARWERGLDVDRAVVVHGPDGEVAAASHIRPFQQRFGGRSVPLAGFSPVAVLPEHRGRGLGRAVTAGQFADLRDRGEVIAGLFPASVALYRGVGFEVAGSYVHRRIPAAHLSPLRLPDSVRVRRGSVDDVAAVHRCYDRIAPGIDGAVTRTEAWWARRLPPDLADTVLYVVDDPGRPGELRGYGSYRHGTARPPYDYSVVVAEVQAVDGDSLRALWGVVGSSGSQAPDVEVIGPAEDPIFLLVGAADPRAVRSEIRWMLRLVDAAGAVAARGWRPGLRGAVDLDVVDDHAPWNAGRWRLEVDDGEARLVPGGTGAVRLGIGALSSWWAGYARARTLASAGLLACADAAALASFDAVGATSPPILVDFY
ncbi:MAG: GNAT family N-acetyltransferase [Acidimicrobiales bacterium]